VEKNRHCSLKISDDWIIRAANSIRSRGKSSPAKRSSSATNGRLYAGKPFVACQTFVESNQQSLVLNSEENFTRLERFAKNRAVNLRLKFKHGKPVAEKISFQP
jgi:hypothetical protein